MADASTIHLVVNSGPAAAEVITGFGEGDRLGLLGFFGPELSFDEAGAGAAVRQSLVADAAGGASLRLEVYEAGAQAPAATVLLVGVAHALGADAVLHW